MLMRSSTRRTAALMAESLKLVNRLCNPSRRFVHEKAFQGFRADTIDMCKARDGPQQLREEVSLNSGYQHGLPLQMRRDGHHTPKTA